MTRLLSKQSDTNMKIIYLNESNINNRKSLNNSRRNNNYFNEVKIFKCFTIFKKRLLEKMKTLVSPRKKDINSLESLQSISSEFVAYNKFKNNYCRSNSGDDDNNFYLISLISKFYNKNKKIRRQRKLMNNLVAVDNGKVTNTQLLSDNNYYLINYRDNLDVRNGTSDLENLLRQS